MYVMQVCFKYSPWDNRALGGNRRKDMACCGGEEEGGRCRSDEAGNGRKVALLSVAPHPEGEGGRS